jgi:hypothetical protein
MAVVAALLLLAAADLAGAASSAVKACRKSCGTLRENCLVAAKAARSAARPACAGDRACKRDAAKRYKRSLGECRTARSACLPCCKLGGPNECARRTGVALAAEPQVGGDPIRGRELLLGGDYMTCGVPYKVYQSVPGVIAGGYGGGADAPRIADRPGKNAAMPYYLNVFTSPEGAEVVNGN